MLWSPCDRVVVDKHKCCAGAHIPLKLTTQAQPKSECCTCGLRPSGASQSQHPNPSTPTSPAPPQHQNPSTSAQHSTSALSLLLCRDVMVVLLMWSERAALAVYPKLLSAEPPVVWAVKILDLSAPPFEPNQGCWTRTPHPMATALVRRMAPGCKRYHTRNEAYWAWRQSTP